VDSIRIDIPLSYLNSAAATPVAGGMDAGMMMAGNVSNSEEEEAAAKPITEKM